MPGLTASELSTMRTAINELMPDTCNVCTLSGTPDGEGGQTVSRATSGTSIACRLDVITGNEMLTGGAMQSYTTYKLSLPYDTTVNPSNIIEHSNVDYAVKSVNRNQSWKAVVRVELERINA